MITISDVQAKALVELAERRGCSVDDVLVDAERALDDFRNVGGRAIVNRSAGVPAMCDLISAFINVLCRDQVEKLCVAVLDEANLIEEIEDAAKRPVNLIELWEVLEYVGHRKRANRVVERWDMIAARYVHVTAQTTVL